MTFIHESDRRQREQQRLEPVEARPEAGWGETYTAAFQYAVDEELSISGALNKEGLRQRRAALRDLIDQGEVNIQDYVDRRGRVDYDRLSQQYDVIKSTETIAEERREMLRKRREQNQDVMERGNGFAQFLGMASAFALDPINLATLPVSSAGVAARSLSWVGKGLLVARREAALNVATELAIQPLVFQHKSDIESPYSWRDAVANIGMAAAGGAGLGFVSGGVSGYLRAVRDKAAPFLQDKESELALRSLADTADFLDRTRPNTARRVLDDEYGKYLSGTYKSIDELRTATRTRLQQELAEAQAQQMPMLRMIADEGGLNERAWREAGFNADDIAQARSVRQGLPKNKPLLRRKGGLTPEDLVQRLAETGYIPDGAVTTTRAIEITRTALRNPDMPANSQAVTRSAELEDMLSRIDAEDEQALEQMFKQSQADEIEGDLQRLREREVIREQMNEPDVKPEQFETPEPETVAPQTLNERQRYVLDRVGLAEEYDQAMEAYARSEGKQVFDPESGRLVDADEVLEEIDEQIEGLNEVLRCTVRA
mgnify:FL=1